MTKQTDIKVRDIVRVRGSHTRGTAVGTYTEQRRGLVDRFVEVRLTSGATVWVHPNGLEVIT